MAVYKPSNCRPFLSTEDLTTNVNVQCEINTSNQNVTGYKLRLLNSINEVIFEGREYSELNKLGQSGINGSLLIVPLIIAEDKVNSDPDDGFIRLANTYPRWEFVDSNSIYYIPEGYPKGANNPHYFRRKEGASKEAIFSSATAEVVPYLSNGNANMPYKWEIFLAQSQIINNKFSQEPVIDWAYDILVATGQILGSNYQRIQSNLSDEIYRDYYIQLLNASGQPIKDVSRVRISSYDRTFGYIFPQEGFITEENMQTARQFKIYKDTNDPNYVSAGRTVNYALTQSVESGLWWTAFAPASIGECTSNDEAFWAPQGVITCPQGFSVGPLAPTGNKYYFDMRISNIRRSDCTLFNSRALDLEKVFHTLGGVNGSAVAFLSTRFLFMKQSIVAGYTPSSEEIQKNEYGSTFSNLNGVWWLVGAQDFKENKAEAERLKNEKEAAEQELEDAEKRISDAQTVLNDKDSTDDDKKQAQNTINFESPRIQKNSGELWIAVQIATQNYENRTGSCYIRWQRPNDANVWANYIGRNWFVADGFVGDGVNGSALYSPQINLSSNAVASTSGVINTSPLAFFPEEAVVIYPKENGVATDAKGIAVNNDTIGTIFRNDKVNGAKIYVKPFVGLRKGMRINWADKAGATYYANISDIDTNYWSIKLNKSNTNASDFGTISTPGTQYKVTSFFKASDENPFYAYTTPTLKILMLKEGEKVPASQVLLETETYPYTSQLNSRDLKVWGKYDQVEHNSWKRFRWILLDMSVNNTQMTENIYDGDIYYYFDGLQDGHQYQLTLEVEDERGIVQTDLIEFQVSLQGLGSEEAFPLDVTFDCDTQSVDIDFVRNGFVVPDYYDSTIYSSMIYEGQIDYNSAINGRFTGNDDKKLNDWETPLSTVENNDGVKQKVEYREESIVIPNGITVQYENTKALIIGVAEDKDSRIDAKLSAPLGNDITFNITSSDINPDFVGEICEVEINLNDEKDYERIKIGLLLPPETVPASKSVPAGIIPNPQRNQILVNYWSEKRGANNTEWIYAPGSGKGGQILPAVPVSFYQNNGEDTLPYWRKGNPVVYSYQNSQTVSDIFDQNPAGIGQFDYLPITYYNPSDTNQIKASVNDKGETVITYLEIDGVPIATFPTLATPDDLVYYYLEPEAINSSISAIQFPVNRHFYDFKVLVNGNSEAKPNDRNERESYRVVIPEEFEEKLKKGEQFYVLLEENLEPEPNDEREQFYVLLEENLEPEPNDEREQFYVLPLEISPNDENAREPYHVHEGGECNLTVWQDEVTYLAKQIDGEKTLMRAKRYIDAMHNGPFVLNVWQDFRTYDGSAPDSLNDINNTINMWNDNCALASTIWRSKDVNGKLSHTGRQEINGENSDFCAKEITFNVALKNFDPNEVSFSELAELQAFGWIEIKPQPKKG